MFGDVWMPCVSFQVGTSSSRLCPCGPLQGAPCGPIPLKSGEFDSLLVLSLSPQSTIELIYENTNYQLELVKKVTDFPCFFGVRGPWACRPGEIRPRPQAAGRMWSGLQATWTQCEC